MGIISCAALLLLAAMASASDPKETRHYDLNNAHKYFEDFMKSFNRVYRDDADKEAHYRAFVTNLENINKMNEQNPDATFGMNKFADYTEEERKSMFGFKRD